MYVGTSIMCFHYNENNRMSINLYFPTRPSVVMPYCINILPFRLTDHLRNVKKKKKGLVLLLSSYISESISLFFFVSYCQA